MAKSDRKPGSNVRVLAIAYATGRITRDAYIKERTRQLGALEFGKPLPDLPQELRDIRIPNIKIDASYINAKRRGRARAKIFGVIIVLLLLAGAGAGVWFSGMLQPKATTQAQVAQPTLEEYANHLLQNPNWSERDLKTFLRLWATRSASARETARDSIWYLKLDNEIIKRINQAKLKQDSGTARLPGEEQQLDLLRAFQSQLSSN